MSDSQSIRRTLELTIPAPEVEEETERVVESIRKRVQLPGFRPGKVPAGIVRRRYQEEIRHDVLERLIPKYLFKRTEEEGLNVVGTPNVTDVHFSPGEPLRFKAEFEVAPEIELKQYKDLPVPYQDPEVSEADIDQRIEELREQKAEYVNVDPRPIAAGDHAVVALESVSGITGPPIKQDELTLHIGGEDTLPGFSEALTGLSPGDEKEFDVTYPEDYAQPRLAGKTVRFRARVKGIRRKELPEVNDEFARDLGDYQNLDELREAVRKAIFAERQYVAQEEAKNKLVDALVDAHDFPVPEAYIERQIEAQVERRLQLLAAEGVDPRSIKLDWQKLKESQRDKAVREVKASLLLHKIADAEGIHATQDEVDREVQRLARQTREPVAAVRMRLEKEGALGRIAARIRTEKTLSFLFDHARKTAE
ncbi:MAG TPA: trigger factor [Bryobacteraceae bacterium]|nr:trigger factor [Bryobacteraceae bacterium]